MREAVFVSSVEGNGQRLDGGAMFGNVPRPLWEKWIVPDDRGRVPLACRAMLAEWPDKKVLCETGIGSFFDEKLADRFGVSDYGRHLLLENLTSLGVVEDQIDVVILSHLHFDHAGGLMPLAGSSRQGLHFPRAEYWVGAESWARACHPHARDRASFPEKLVKLLQESGRLRIIAAGDVPTGWESRLSFHYSGGHTPGQMHTTIFGESSQVTFCGDLIPGTHWVHLPVTMGYDRFPELLIDEKESFYRSILGKDAWLFYTHDPEFSSSRLSRRENGPFIAAEKQVNWQRYRL